MQSLESVSQSELISAVQQMKNAVDEKMQRLDFLLETRRYDITLDMRYGEQIFEIKVPATLSSLERADFTDEMAALFHKAHEELYTYALPDQEVVLVNVRLSGVGVMASMPSESTVETSNSLTVASSRIIFVDGVWREVNVYSLDDLTAGVAVSGPAIIESKTTTVLLHGGDRVTVTNQGWLDIEVSDLAGVATFDAALAS
jgi:N-methylhydantoinase A